MEPWHDQIALDATDTKSRVEMKASEHISATTASASRQHQPFFSKGGRDMADKGQEHFFNRSPVQTKLSVGQPNDKYEIEADAMADQVVQRLASGDSVQTKSQFGISPTPFVQMKCDSCEKEEKLQKKEDDPEKDMDKIKVQRKPVFESPGKPQEEIKLQRKCDGCEKEDEGKIQAKPEILDSSEEFTSIENKLSSTGGTGDPLPETSRNRMETAFGADFSNVRVHNDSHAVQMNRELHAQAFTHGSDIYFNQGKYDLGNKGGHHLLAHELTHVLQQGKAPLADVQKKTESKSDGLIQRAPGKGSTSKEDELPAPRNEIELIGMRLKSRQIDLLSFLTEAKTDIENIRKYFEWVNGVYTRCYDHYKLVLDQVKAELETAQKWFDFIFGLVVGVSIGLMSEALFVAEGAALFLELVVEVGAEITEGLIGLIKPDIPKPKLLNSLAPEFKQVQSLQILDRLNTVVLKMAIPGTFTYTDPIVQCERLSAELRIIETHKKNAARRIPDADIRTMYLKLMLFDLRTKMAETEIDKSKKEFDLLRVLYTGKAAPSDQRCEQDIWIPWIAHQDINTFFAPVIFNEQIRHHLVDIGLVGWEGKGGRLNIKVGDLRSSLFEPSAGELIEKQDIVNDMHNASVAEAALLPNYWQDVFLMGGVKK
jgi:hypothetical protein